MSETLRPATFAVLDLDRTLLNTNKLVSYYGAELSGQFDAPVIANLDQARQESEARGVSFDIYSHLAAEISLAEVDNFNQDFLVKHHSVDMLNPGAADLLISLTLHQQAYGILTHGSKPWQSFKLLVSQLDHIPHIITNQARKSGVTVAAWQLDGGQFQVPAELVSTGDQRLFDRIVVVDDKLIALEDMPTGANGLLYLPGTRPDDVVKSYPNLLESIKVISDLGQVGHYLRPQDVAIRALSTSRKQYASI